MPNISLEAIQSAIKANCVIEKKAIKALTLERQCGQGLSIKGIGRCLFIYIARAAGYTPEEICDYLAINLREYDTKTEALEDLYVTGKKLFENSGNHFTYLETRDTYLFFYRKLVLIRNYLKYRYNFIIN